MVVVNDCEERGIALIKEFNKTLTKDEAQKQYLFRIVAQHRRELKLLTKTGLKNNKDLVRCRMYVCCYIL